MEIRGDRPPSCEKHVRRGSSTPTLVIEMVEGTTTLIGARGAQARAEIRGATQSSLGEPRHLVNIVIDGAGARGACRRVLGASNSKMVALLLLLLLLMFSGGGGGILTCEAATIKIGFLVDWGLRSPLYPAAAAAAANASVAALEKSGVLERGDRVEWVWHDSACDARRAYHATQTLLDTYGVDFIVGPACCSSAAVAGVLAGGRGVPVISWACSAQFLSDKQIFPSFLRVVGSSDEMSAAVASLLSTRGSEIASIVFADGPSRGLTYSSIALKLRSVLEERRISIGVWKAFSGDEACTTAAGDAEGVREAVEAVEKSANTIVVVLGECADYRQVMTRAASRGLGSKLTWILLSAARDPACHTSKMICGRDDGRDDLALSALGGALAIDWSVMPTDRPTIAAYVEAAAAYNREDFASRFLPPPAGNALPKPSVAPWSLSSCVGDMDAGQHGGGRDNSRSCGCSRQSSETFPDGRCASASCSAADVDALESSAKLVTSREDSSWRVADHSTGSGVDGPSTDLPSNDEKRPLAALQRESSPPSGGDASSSPGRGVSESSPAEEGSTAYSGTGVTSLSSSRVGGVENPQARRQRKDDDNRDTNRSGKVARCDVSTCGTADTCRSGICTGRSSRPPLVTGKTTENAPPFAAHAACDSGGEDRSNGVAQSRGGVVDVEGDGYVAVDLSAPAGSLPAATLMFDAVELGARVLTAATGSRRSEAEGARAGVEWAKIASEIEFEGLSGRVEMDDEGNRKGMDVSFWLLDSVVVGGVSYLAATEAVRYDSRSGRIEVVREVGLPANPASVKIAGNSSRPPAAIKDFFHGVYFPLAVLLSCSICVFLLTIRPRSSKSAAFHKDDGSSTPSYPRSSHAEAITAELSGGREQDSAGAAEASVEGRTHATTDLTRQSAAARHEARRQDQEQREYRPLEGRWEHQRYRAQERCTSSEDTSQALVGNNGSSRFVERRYDDEPEAPVYTVAAAEAAAAATARSTAATRGTRGGWAQDKEGAEQGQQETGATQRGSAQAPGLGDSFISGDVRGREERRTRRTSALDESGARPTAAAVATTVLRRAKAQYETFPSPSAHTARMLRSLISKRKSGEAIPASTALSVRNWEQDAGLTSRLMDIVGRGSTVEGRETTSTAGVSTASRPLHLSKIDAHLSGDRSDELGAAWQREYVAFRGQSSTSPSRKSPAAPPVTASTSPLPPSHSSLSPPPFQNANFADVTASLLEDEAIPATDASHSPPSAHMLAGSRTVHSPGRGAANRVARVANSASQATQHDAFAFRDTASEEREEAKKSSLAKTVDAVASAGAGGMISGGAEDLGERERNWQSDGSERQEGAGVGSELSTEVDEYDMVTYRPPSQERLKIVQDELRQLSDRASLALNEIEVDADDIAIGEIIGSGSSAEVRKGRVRGKVPGVFEYVSDSQTGATIDRRTRERGIANPSDPGAPASVGRGAMAGMPQIAVKVLRDAKRQTLKRFWSEVLIMKDLDHPNIVRLLGATWRGPRLMMIMEYVSRDNLATVLEEGPSLTWRDQKFNMCIDIAKGMAYLHRYKYFDELSNSMQNCVIHRDLKPHNLLVTHDFRIKITDFGEATGKGDDAARTQVGTLLYIAPEIVRGDRYDERCDVYSFAVVLLAMLELRMDVIMLFGEEALRRGKDKLGTHGAFTHIAITNSIVNENLRPTLPPDVYATLKILIVQCWDPAPALRPTFEEILEFLETIARDEIMDGQTVQDFSDVDLESMEFLAQQEEDEILHDRVPSTGDATVGGAHAGPPAAGSIEETGLVEREQARPDAVGEASTVSGPHRGWEQLPRGKKRGKDYRPKKGNMGMEFLEKHKDLPGWKPQTELYTIHGDEEGEDEEDDDQDNGEGDTGNGDGGQDEQTEHRVYHEGVPIMSSSVTSRPPPASFAGAVNAVDAATAADPERFATAAGAGRFDDPWMDASGRFTPAYSHLSEAEDELAFSRNGPDLWDTPSHDASGVRGGGFSVGAVGGHGEAMLASRSPGFALQDREGDLESKSQAGADGEWRDRTSWLPSEHIADEDRREQGGKSVGDQPSEESDESSLRTAIDAPRDMLEGTVPVPQEDEGASAFAGSDVVKETVAPTGATTLALTHMAEPEEEREAQWPSGGDSPDAESTGASGTEEESKAEAAESAVPGHSPASSIEADFDTHTDVSPLRERRGSGGSLTMGDDQAARSYQGLDSSQSSDVGQGGAMMGGNGPVL